MLAVFLAFLPDAVHANSSPEFVLSCHELVTMVTACLFSLITHMYSGEGNKQPLCCIQDSPDTSLIISYYFISPSTMLIYVHATFSPKEGRVSIL